MRVSLFMSRLALLIGIALSSQADFGQTTPTKLLSIKKQDSKYWIQANPPTGASYTLQTTENMHLWVDVGDELFAPLTMPFDDSQVTLRYFRLIPTPDAAPTINFMLIGDSMASECCGWGQGMPAFFKANTTIINYALAWQSSRVFLNAPYYTNMKLIKPDYVLINFAYMEVTPDPNTFVQAPEFEANYRKILGDIQGWGGVPVLITLHAARLWDTQGNLIPTDHYYNPIIRRLAAEYHAPLIDLYDLTRKMLLQLGEAGSEFMKRTEAPIDELHLSPLGATYVARLVNQNLPPALGPYMTGIFDPPPKP
jgi:hypothetical protein